MLEEIDGLVGLIGLLCYINNHSLTLYPMHVYDHSLLMYNKNFTKICLINYVLAHFSTLIISSCVRFAIPQTLTVKKHIEYKEFKSSNIFLSVFWHYFKILSDLEGARFNFTRVMT